MNSQTGSRDLNEDTLREQIHLAMKQLPTMQAASFIVALVLAFSVRDSVPHANIYAWILMVLAVVVSRIVHYLRFLRVRDQLFAGRYWKNICLVLVFLSGIVWGLSAFIIFPVGNPGLIALFVLVMASLSAATTVSHSSIRLAPTAWAGPAMLLYAVRCAMEGGEAGYTLSGLIVLYLFTVLRYSFIHHDTITSAIALKFENLGLLEEVRKTQDILETRVEERTAELRHSNESLIREMGERELAEAALRAGEERYRELVKHANSIVVRWNAKGVITFVNEFAQRFFGYAEEELVGKNVMETIVALVSREGVDLEKMIQGIWHNLRVFERNENENLRKNGERVWISWTNQPIFSKSGELVELLSIGQDITERKRAEDALRESEKKYRLLADNVSDVIFTMDFNLQLTYVSPSAERSYGWTAEELQAFHPSDYMTPASAKLVSEMLAYELALQGSPEADPNRVRTIEIEQVRKDGTIFWTEVTARFLYGSSGEPVGIIGATRDISERKHADKALQESEERFRLLFDGAADAFFITDLQGRLVNVNRAACESLGFARDELLQMSVPDIEVGQSPEDMVALWERIGLGHGITVEGVHRRRDGSTFPVEIHIIPFALDESPLMFGVARDITDRKRTQEEMIHLRNYLANIIDSMPSMLVGVDADGHVTQWNAAAESLTGISAVEILGQGLGEVLPSLNHVLEHVHEAVRTRSVRSKSKTPRLVGGKMRYEDITVYPLAGLGMTGAVIRIDDVTEKVKLEEMMIQSEKMLSVGGLAAGMAHEINNPLGVILQASQNVLRRVSPDLPANARIAEACGTTLGAVRNYLEQREISLFLEDIRNSGFRAAQIVENMLDFSRMSDTKGSPTDMVSLLDRAVDLAASDFDLKKGFDFREIEILREVHPDVPLVICQPSKIQQVFLNILRNGAEAMMEARASGRTPRFVLRVLRDESMVRIEIEDNGPGMDEGMRRRIFEPFFTTKDPGKGIGLGLSVSYFIITEEHGGTLEVESQLETGSRFIIRLPAGGE